MSSRVAEVGKEEAIASDDGNGTSATASSRGTSKRAQVFDIRAFCVGTQPLLMNRFDRDKMIDVLVYGKKEAPDRESPLEPRAAKTIFRDDEGNIVIPTESILACLCVGGCGVTFQGRRNLSKAGGRDSMVPDFLTIMDGEYVRLLLPDGTPTTEKDWVVDVRRGTLPDGKTPCPVIRAKFARWAFLLNVRVDLSKLTGLQLSTVRKLVETAGNSAGLGGFRKAFGRFTIADGGWRVTEVDESTLERPKAPAHLMEEV